MDGGALKAWIDGTEIGHSREEPQDFLCMWRRFEFGSCFGKVARLPDRSNFIRLLAWCSGALLWFHSTQLSAAADPARSVIPHTVLWAWQREENLMFINPSETGVAYLACSVILTGDFVRPIWRDQPLHVPPRTIVIPVVRVDTDRLHAPGLTDDQADKLAHLIARVAHRPSTAAVQIDFDAVETERPFYRKLIDTLKPLLPDKVALSITSLASWCIWDNWIKALPVDETVPMMFSLGRDREKLLLYFRSGHDFRDSRCYESIGVSLEDLVVNKLMIPLSKRRKIPVRVYVFTRTAWTREKFAAVRSMLGAK